MQYQGRNIAECFININNYGCACVVFFFPHMGNRFQSDSLIRSNIRDLVRQHARPSYSVIELVLVLGELKVCVCVCAFVGVHAKHKSTESGIDRYRYLRS